MGKKSKDIKVNGEETILYISNKTGLPAEFIKEKLDFICFLILEYKNIKDLKLMKRKFCPLIKGYCEPDCVFREKNFSYTKEGILEDIYYECNLAISFSNHMDEIATDLASIDSEITGIKDLIEKFIYEKYRSK